MLDTESDTAAYAGQFSKARELTRRASESAQRADEKETAAGYVAESAWREALVGDMSLAKQQAQAALALRLAEMLKLYQPSHWDWRVTPRKPPGWPPTWPSAFRKTRLCSLNYLPTIGAVAALQGGSASRAIEALAPVAP